MKDPEAFKAMSGGADSTQKGWIEVDHERYQWIVDMRDWLKKERRKTG
jgi:phosphonate transport system substrate-binding protein